MGRESGDPDASGSGVRMTTLKLDERGITKMEGVPDTLTVVLVNKSSVTIALRHFNETQPSEYRTVQIRLTEEQREQLALRCTGMSNGNMHYEEIYRSWLEMDQEIISEENNALPRTE